MGGKQHRRPHPVPFDEHFHVPRFRLLTARLLGYDAEALKLGATMPEEPLLPIATSSGGPLAGACVPLNGIARLPRVAPYLMLDAWRGVASLWVVMLHACSPYLLNGHSVLLKNPLFLLSSWGRLGVTIFFVISGYCITGAAYHSISSGKSVVRFCADRCRRIYPPYLVALSVAVILLVSINFLSSRHLLPDVRSARASLPTGATFWLANLTLMQAVVGQASFLFIAWSLCFEVAFYGIIACLLQAGVWWKEGNPQHRLTLLAVGIGALTSGSLVWLCLSPATCPFPFQLWYQFGFGSLLFLLFASDAGQLARNVQSFGTVVRLSLCAALALAILFAVLVSETTPTLGTPSQRTQAIATITFCVILYFLRRHDTRLLSNKLSACLARLGAISYSLYLIHVPVLPFVDAGLRRLGFVGAWYVVSYFAQIGVAVAAGRLFFQWIERRFISGRQIRRMATE